ncbi:Uncharacterised protein [uncultured archaeon]|nr:Uncharacterised protein [uncultured archaeon]
MLSSGNVGVTEKTGLLYFYYGENTLKIQSKKVIIGNSTGSRLVWLVIPAG